jgi:hypothetical protein
LGGERALIAYLVYNLLGFTIDDQCGAVSVSGVTMQAVRLRPRIDAPFPANGIISPFDDLQRLDINLRWLRGKNGSWVRKPPPWAPQFPSSAANLYRVRVISSCRHERLDASASPRALVREHPSRHTAVLTGRPVGCLALRSAKPTRLAPGKDTRDAQQAVRQTVQRGEGRSLADSALSTAPPPEVRAPASARKPTIRRPPRCPSSDSLGAKALQVDQKARLSEGKH